MLGILIHRRMQPLWAGVLAFALLFALAIALAPTSAPVQAQNTACYRAQGGALWACDDGGTMEFHDGAILGIEDGATLDVQSGATLTVDSGASVAIDDFLTLVPQTAISLTMNGTLTPTGSLQLLESAGAVSVSGANIVDGAQGDLLILLNIGGSTITITETTGLISAGNIALGTLDSATLVYRGTSWYQIGASNN